MTTDSRFCAASEAGHSWPNTIALFCRFIEHENVDIADSVQLLSQLLRGYQEHGELLHQLKDRLSLASRGQVKWEQGRGLSALARCPSRVFPHVWSSAHEAVVQITYLTLLEFAVPLREITDPDEQWAHAQGLLTGEWAKKWAQAFEISESEVADWQERIRSERVKFLNQQESNKIGKIDCAVQTPDSFEAYQREVPAFCFIPSGKGYYIAGFGEGGHLQDYAGLDHIFRLIQIPGKGVDMMELDSAEAANLDPRSRQLAIEEDEFKGRVAKLKELREKLREYTSDLERETAENNMVAAAHTRSAIETIETEIREHKDLLDSTTYKGKPRDLNNPFNKLRARIHGRLKSVWSAMEKANPPMIKLAEHFKSFIFSEGGTQFVYRPVGPVPPWRFEFLKKPTNEHQI